jgi:hypothetical protein
MEFGMKKTHSAKGFLRSFRFFLKDRIASKKGDAV